MTCPYLQYHREADGRTFETARAYCDVAEAFVEPMRADVCNDRYDLDHETHCEIFRTHEDVQQHERATEAEETTEANEDE